MAAKVSRVLCLLAGYSILLQGAPQFAQAQWPVDESQQCDPTAQSSSECNAHTIVPYPSCICSDVPVQVSAPSAPLYTCAQEYNNGNCGQSFLKNTVVTIPEGYCQITCGTCNCTSTISQVLTQLQANMFLQAAEMSGMKAQFDLPGFTATIMAPSDAAFSTFLNGAPLSSMASDALLQLMELHVLPPVPVLYATWTTPFFGSNPTLATWLGPNLTAAKATTGPANFTVTSGSGPAANIIAADMEASRSHVNILDTVLTLPTNSVSVPLPAANSGPNGTGVAIETFNGTAYPVLLMGATLPVLPASAAPSMMSVQTAG
ncbi:hypothetical protein WJX79_003118 [Trebouxia sp. C0005]